MARIDSMKRKVAEAELNIAQSLSDKRLTQASREALQEFKMFLDNLDDVRARDWDSWLPQVKRRIMNNGLCARPTPSHPLHQ
jgi:hypothetical protein